MLFVCECLPRLLINSSIARKNLAFSKFGRLPSWQPPLVRCFRCWFPPLPISGSFYWRKKCVHDQVIYRDLARFCDGNWDTKISIFQPCSERSNHPAFRSLPTGRGFCCATSQDVEKIGLENTTLQHFRLTHQPPNPSASGALLSVAPSHQFSGGDI